jgi:uncharacterized membrane protein
MIILRLLTLWVHLLSVIIWIGGSLFLVLVLLPITRQAMTPQESISFHQKVGKRFQVIVWICVGILLMSGIFNVLNRGAFTGYVFSDSYFKILAVKMFFFFILLGLMALHSFVLVPRMASLAEKGAAPEELGRIRKKSVMVSAASLLIGLFILFLGLMLPNV